MESQEKPIEKLTELIARLPVSRDTKLELLAKIMNVLNDLKPKEAVVKCHSCGEIALYKDEDLRWEGQEEPDFYVECKKCGEQTGRNDEFQILIDRLPEPESEIL